MGAPTPGGGRQHTILPKFLKNCIKLEGIWTRGEGGVRLKFYCVDPPLHAALGVAPFDKDNYETKNKDF